MKFSSKHILGLTAVILLLFVIIANRKSASLGGQSLKADQQRLPEEKSVSVDIPQGPNTAINLEIESPIESTSSEIPKPTSEIPSSPKLNPKELKSISQLSQLMTESHRSFVTTKQIIKKYKSLGLNTKLQSNSNPYTGKMDVIQNENRIPGTRYVISQIMEDSNKKQFVERSSFEVRPGPDSFEQTANAVEKSLPRGAVLALSTKERKTWRLPGGAIRNVKILNADDLVSTPYKVYDKQKDIGTVLVWEEEDVEDAFTD